ncbi:hypothetical protein [Streptomyces sp. NPDC002908]
MDTDFGAFGEADLPGLGRIIDGFGQYPQPHVGADGASLFREQGPHLADGPVAVGEVRRSIVKVPERGQELVGEDYAVLRTAGRRLIPQSRRMPHWRRLLPQRVYVVAEFSDHSR